MNHRLRHGHLRLLAPGESAERTEVLPVGGPGEARIDDGAGTLGVLGGGGHALVRAAYRALLEVDERLKVVGGATSGNHAVALPGRVQPDVVLLDLGLPGFEQQDVMARILSLARLFLVDAAVIVIAPSLTDERAFAALRAGAVGVLASDARPDELRAAVRMIAAGQAVLPAAMVDRLIDELPTRGSENSPAPERLRELTDRERDVVALVGKRLEQRANRTPPGDQPGPPRRHTYTGRCPRFTSGAAGELVVLAYETRLVHTQTPASPRPLRLRTTS